MASLIITKEYQRNLTIQYCFPDNNLSCRREVRASPANGILSFFLSCISVCTVILNLLVIISIAHFKQLHTPTNLLILSLAGADVLVGLIVMPVRIMEMADNCWYFGRLACAAFLVISSLSLSASICSLVFISVDRYIAVTDPLLYSTKVTVGKMSFMISTGWSYSLLYGIIFLYFNDSLLQFQGVSKCYGECVYIVKYVWGIVDLLLFLLFPCVFILVLYSIIFNVARHQAKAVRAAKNWRHTAKESNSSETKAAKKLAIIVFIYLACWIPFYLSSLMTETSSSFSVVVTILNWLVFINSLANPLIYAIFYPWFRKSVKYILTCHILESTSYRLNLFPEHV